ncbi:low molecular weight protein arginine phosphatase [Verrucomicrobiota bacterium]
MKVHNSNEGENDKRPGRNSCCSGSSAPDEGGRRHVLFICTGNLCRSPMAEYLFRHHMGPDLTWRASSAGISAPDGVPASTLAVQLLREKGINLTPHRSQCVTKRLVNSADLIVVMTDSHAGEMIKRFPKARDKVFLLKSFGAESPGGDTRDPMGLSEDMYGKILEEIDEALLDLFVYLRSC